MQTRLRVIRWEGEDVCSYTLEPVAGEHLPHFSAGAHIDVSLAPGLVRSYSLLNDPAEADRYEIAVHRAPESRGGSSRIHEHWRAGDLIEIAAPRNNFALNEAAAHTVLIAGGIGITPMLSMIARLQALGRGWELHYVTRTRARAAFLDRLSRHPQVRLAFDHEPGGCALELALVVEAAPAEAHLYCCGPGPMLRAFEALTASRPRGHAHVEYFAASETPAAAGGYDLRLERSGKVIRVASGERMLAALLAAGVNVSYSCSEGICGTCETRVVAGVPDHRDDYLTDAEKATNAVVMPCCSGSKTPTLTLDI